jgi:hypothetical protein
VSYDLIPCQCGAVQLDPYHDGVSNAGTITRYVQEGPNRGHHGAGPGAKCRPAPAPDTAKED